MPCFSPFQNVLYLVSVAIMQMSCQSKPQHGGEVIVAVCGLPELYIYIILYTIIILLYIISRPKAMCTSHLFMYGISLLLKWVVIFKCACVLLRRRGRRNCLVTVGGVLSEMHLTQKSMYGLISKFVYVWQHQKPKTPLIPGSVVFIMSP